MLGKVRVHVCLCVCVCVCVYVCVCGVVKPRATVCKCSLSLSIYLRVSLLGFPLYSSHSLASQNKIGFPNQEGIMSFYRHMPGVKLTFAIFVCLVIFVLVKKKPWGKILFFSHLSYISRIFMFCTFPNEIRRNLI